MAERPIDRIETAGVALGAVCDLLTAAGTNSLNEVSADRLAMLLDLLRREILDGVEAVWADHGASAA